MCITLLSKQDTRTEAMKEIDYIINNHTLNETLRQRLVYIKEMVWRMPTPIQNQNI